MLSVVIESPKTVPVIDYQFYQGQEIWVTGKETELPSLGFPGFPVWIEITGDGLVPLQYQSSTDWLGNFAEPFILPSVNSKIKIKVTASRITDNDIVILNASIGNVIPDNPVQPPSPTPVVPSLPDITSSWEAFAKWLPWIALGLGVIYLVTILPKGNVGNLLPRGKS